MNEDRWARVKELFEACLSLPADRQRPFLEQRCGGDAGLLGEVQRLLAEDAATDGYMVPPAPEQVPRADMGAHTSAGARIGMRIGAYRLRQLIGQGGMASVYLAERVGADFEQQVAVKLLKRGMDTDDILERFRQERQVLADLVHPGIAGLIDGGSTGDGLPYLVMEVVDGQPIDRYCDAHRLDVEQRLRLFQKVCEAVEYAHRSGVVHRDLKPNNILVTGAGEPKLLDFGIAKLVDATGNVQTVDVTATELRLMTPEYASPEQVAAGKASPASDVYSLGVVLYELLSGHRPYRTTTPLRRDIERAILEESPRRPSQMVERPRERAGSGPLPAAEISDRRGTATRRLRSALAGDLDTIVMMALRKEPERRYASAGELMADIERSLTGRPVHARADTWRYRSAKFVRRNRLLVASALAVILALSIGLAVAQVQYRGANAERARAEAREYVARIAAAAGSLRAADVADGRRHLELAAQEQRGWEWHHLRARSDRSRWAATVGDAADAVAWDPQGHYVAVGERHGGDVIFLDPSSGAQEARFPGLGGARLWLGPFPDGAKLVAYTRDTRQLRSLDLETREVREVWQGPGTTTLDVDVASGRMASGDEHGRVVLWDTVKWNELRLLAALEAPITAVALGQTTVACGAAGALHLGKLESPPMRRIPIDVQVNDLALDPEEERIATACEDGSLRVFEVASGAELWTAREHTQGVVSVDFDAQGLRIVTASIDRTISVWNAATGARTGLLLGHTERVMAAGFDPVSNRIVSCAWDGTARLWAGDTDDVPRIRADAAWIHSLAVSPDGGRIAVPAWSEDDTAAGAEVWDTQQRTRLWRSLDAAPTTVRDRITRIAWDVDGARLATVHDRDPTIRIWSATGELEKKLAASVTWPQAAFAPGGLLATGGYSLSLRDLGPGEHSRRFQELDEDIREIAFSTDGHRVLTGHLSKAILWDVESGQQLMALPVEGGLCAVALHPDGEHAATGSRDGTVRFWRFADSKLLKTAAAHSATVTGLTYSPDGSRLVSCSWDKALKVWDAGDGLELATLHGHEERITDVAFSPDGMRLFSIDQGGSICLWDSVR